MKKSLLLLEGGAYRGIFTSGVLDAFLANDIYFDTVVGISAGALCGYNYVSKDLGRSRDIVFDYGQDKRYFGVRNLIKTGSAFGSGFVFDELPKSMSFNLEQFQNGADFYVGATNCHTGECEYFSKKDPDVNFVDCIVASASMPLVSKMVKIKDELYLDGGIAEHLPLGFIESGDYDYIVCVLTRPVDAKKGMLNKQQAKLYKLRYKKYPELLDKLLKESEIFNMQRQLIASLKAEGRITVIEPDERFTVRRVERNKETIHQGYHLGYEAAQERIEEIKRKLGER